MLALSNEVENSDRYQSPAKLTVEGQLDRRHERQHALTIRDYERGARKAVAAAALETARDIAWIQGRARVATEAKYALERAQKESDFMAQGDPIRHARFGILDDDLFALTGPLVAKSFSYESYQLFA